MNMILVDDEILMIEALKKIISDGMLDIRVSGEAHDGIAALEMFERLRPDLAIIDIRMPKMDGLQLIQALKERGLNTKILILSAYRDFDYAQKALQLGASGYLVKPIDRVKLMDELNRVMQKIRDENNISTMVDIAAKSIPLLKANYLRQLLDGSAQPEEAENHGRVFVDVEEQDCQLVLVSLDIPPSGGSLLPPMSELEQKVLECIEARLFVKIKGAACFTGGNELAAVFNFREGTDAISLAGSIRDSILKLLPIDMDIGISREGYPFARIADAYRDARDALVFKFYLGPNAVIPYRRIEKIRLQNSLVLIEDEDYLIDQIKMGIGEDVQRIFAAMRERLENSMDAHPDAVYQAYYNLMLYLRKALKDSFTEAELQALLPSFDLDDLRRHRTLGELSSFIQLLIQNVLAYIEIKRKNEDSRLIEKVKRYCEVNYAKDITLDAISEHVNMAKNYFCSQFKKKTGESFWDYLTKLRISKAKDLLEKTEMKIVAISEKVGYKNASHFCRVFKELAGVSPAEYKLKYLKKNS